MSTPTLSQLMLASRARAAQRNAGTPEKWADAQIEEMLAERALAQQQQLSTPDRSRQGPAPQTVSPQVFAPQNVEAPHAAAGIYTNDPSAVLGMREENSPRYLATLRKQLEGLALQVPGWQGRSMEFFEGTMVDPGGTAIDLRDEKQVVPYVSRLMDEVRVGRKPGLSPSAPDVLQGLILKATESNPAASTFLPFPKDLAERYGILGVDGANLSAGEQILLRRMGVLLPIPKSRRR